MEEINNNPKLYETFLDNKGQEHSIHIHRPLNEKTAELFMNNDLPYRFYKAHYSQIFYYDTNSNRIQDKKILMNNGIAELFCKYVKLFKNKGDK